MKTETEQEVPALPRNKAESAQWAANGWRHDALRYLGSRQEMRIRKAERMEQISREASDQSLPIGILAVTAPEDDKP